MQIILMLWIICSISMMKKAENQSWMNMAIDFFEKNFIWTD